MNHFEAYFALLKKHQKLDLYLANYFCPTNSLLQKEACLK